MKRAIWMGLGLSATLFATTASADWLQQALDGGKSYGDLRLRYESVEQNNAAKDATAITLRTRLGFATAEVNGFSAQLELEDSRSVLGGDEYTTGGYSVVADPETTELDQAFLKYNNNGLTVKYGRQLLTFDNHRFVGHVGWRQDRQTFDGLSVNYAKGKATATLAYIEKRNRILAENADIDSKDVLANLAYKTDLGKLSAYAYLLEVDNNSNNAIDSYGLRWVGKLDKGLPVSYTLEYATQESVAAGVKNDADYWLVELATQVKTLAVKLGYEVLGSDQGNYGFATPLATGHKFNGWADTFLATPTTGLVDAYISVGGKIAGGKWLLAYHDFTADKASATVDDLGDELNLLYARKFGKRYQAGIKYAAYSAGDAGAGKVDTDKLWVWTSIAF